MRRYFTNLIKKQNSLIDDFRRIYDIRNLAICQYEGITFYGIPASSNSELESEITNTFLTKDESQISLVQIDCAKYLEMAGTN